MSHEPLPVSIITGFLGAGKTTLLNRLLKDPALADAAVIINEFGETGIDHLLVERADEGVMELSSGCICCTIRGDLIDTMEDLLARRDAGRVRAFSRILIETTGLADPAPILHTLMSHEGLLARLRLQGVMTVVDAVNGLATLDAHEEAVKQVAVADRIVLTKSDLMVGRQGEDQLHAIIARLRALAPGARLLDNYSGEATAARLMNAGLYDPVTKSMDVRGWLNAQAYGRGAHHHGHDHDHHHDHDHDHRHDGIQSYSVAIDGALSPASLGLFLDLLRSYHGPKLLRVKGIIRVSDDEARPVVIHGVQHVFHPPVRLAAWPDDDHASRLVVIAKDLPREQIEGLLKAFSDPLTGHGVSAFDDTLSLRR